MSAEATFWAWEQDLNTSSLKMVLLCLADCHNADTKLCNPSADYIAIKTRCNRKTILKNIKELEELGLIEIQKSLGRSNRYALNIGKKIKDKEIHIVYKTIDPNTGEYYIGVHSSSTLNDGYKGSGTWISQHKTKYLLKREIILELEDRERAEGAEVGIIASCIDDPKCMNRLDKTNTKNGTTKNGTTQKEPSPNIPDTSTKNGEIPSPNLGHKSKSNLKDESKSIPPKKDSPKYSEEHLAFAQECLEEIKLINPSTNSKAETWAEDVRKLIELDNLTLEQINSAWQWARNDDFWKLNCKSLSKLRQRNKQGIYFIEQFLEAQSHENTTRNDSGKPHKSSAYDRVMQGIEQDRDSENLGDDGEHVRSQMDHELRGGSRPLGSVGSDIEGDFRRTN